MNGAKGRARQLAKIRRSRLAWAKADGVDITDRAAFAAWERDRLKALCDSILEDAARVQEKPNA